MPLAKDVLETLLPSPLKSYRHHIWNHSLSSFALLSTVHSFNSSIMLIFAQVVGVELKSALLQRAAHSIYCTDPSARVSKEANSVDWWGCCMKLGGFEEELTQLSVGVVWLVVHIGGGIMCMWVCVLGLCPNSWSTWPSVNSLEARACSFS